MAIEKIRREGKSALEEIHLESDTLVLDLTTLLRYNVALWDRIAMWAYDCVTLVIAHWNIFHQ